MKFGVHPVRQHAGTIGEHAKPTFVASNGLVNTALVALALIVGLWKQRVSVFITLFFCEHRSLKNTHPLLPSLGEDDHNAALPLAASPSHSLHEADGILLCIKTDDEVYLSNIQPLFPHTGGHQRVETSLTEPVHHLKHEEEE